MCLLAIIGPELVAAAIKQGYRLIDTAEFYDNEQGVGHGLKQSGRKREEIFVVSKWWPSSTGAKGALATLDRCLTRWLIDESIVHVDCLFIYVVSLQSTYVDLYLLHAPQGGHCAEAYRALLDAKKHGKIRLFALLRYSIICQMMFIDRSLGVSNFGIAHLEALVKLGLDKPSVNQIELHPWQQKKEIVEYCFQHDITVMGYSPLAKGQKVQDRTIVNMANK
jgi:methylglyoxal/glyoxal reductase